ncbi:uncharacterized protein LOC144747139 [Ciona intestinalis]
MKSQFEAQVLMEELRTKIVQITKSQFGVQVLMEELRTKIVLIMKSQFGVQVLIIVDMRYLYKELRRTTVDMKSQFQLHQNRTNLAQVDIQQCIEPTKLFDYPTRRIYVFLENNRKIPKNESDQNSLLGFQI